VKKVPREEYFYFDQGGHLNAVRWNEWKVSFASVTGNIAEGTRAVPRWPQIVNLRADPYEKAPTEADLGYLRWYGDLLWLFVPVQQKIKEFFVDFEAYPYQAGASLNAAGINYRTLQAAQALKRLNEIEGLSPPSN
jgi:arylsulfatase